MKITTPDLEVIGRMADADPRLIQDVIIVADLGVTFSVASTRADLREQVTLLRHVLYHIEQAADLSEGI